MSTEPVSIERSAMTLPMMRWFFCTITPPFFKKGHQLRLFGNNEI
jgi:hypothetical protein